MQYRGAMRSTEQPCLINLLERFSRWLATFGKRAKGGKPDVSQEAGATEN